MPNTNDLLYEYSTQVTAISGTANVAAAGFNGSAEVVAMNSANHYNMPLADGALFISLSTSVSSASNFVNLYRRDINIDGTGDSPLPQSAAPAYSNLFVGAFLVPPFTATSTAYLALTDIPLTLDCEFYIENKTNATIVQPFTLKLKPKTFVPSP